MTILLLPERKHIIASPIGLWLARGDHLPDQPPGDEALLRSVFEFEGALSVAALTRQHDVGDAGDAQWLRADPAWVRADMMTARMFAHGELGLSAQEVVALTPDLTELFAEHDLVFDAPTPTRWYLRCPDDLQLPPFVDPDDAIGDDLKLHLPQGAAGKRWRVLTNDLQILLHNHPVNERRVARGAAAVNSLWLWGGGRLPAHVRTAATLIHADDIVVRALAGQVAERGRPALAAIGEPIGDRPQKVVDLRHQRGESLQSSLTTIAANTVLQHGTPIDLRLNSGERYRYRSRHRWRFWRPDAKR